MGKSVEQMAQQLRGNATKYDEIYQQELKKRLMDEQARQRRRELMQQIERNAAMKKTAELQKPIADKMPNISIQPVNAAGFPPMKAATGNLLQPGTNGKPLATPFPLKEYQFNTQNPFTPPMKKPAENTRTWTPQDRAAATSDVLKQQQTLAAGYSKAAHNAAQQNKLSLWEQIKLGAGQLGVKGLSAIDTVNNNVAFNGTAPSAAAAFLRNNTPGYKPVDSAGALEQKISPLAQRADALTQQEEALAYGKMAQTRESLERAARAAADFDPNNTAGAKENYTGGSPMTSAWLPFLEALSMAGTSGDTTTPVSAVNGIGQQAVIDGMREIKNDLAPAAEYLTDEQRSVYNYYARGDADKAEKYLETLQYATDAAKVAEQSDIAKRAGDNGAAGAAYTLAMHAGGQASSPLALLDVAGRGLKNKVSGEYMPLNQNSDAMAAQALPDAAMTGMQSDMSPVGRTATDLAVGIADNVANFALLGAAAPAVMAAQSGGRGAYDAAQKGATPGQALASGAAQGAAEYLGESFSFKKLDNVLHGMPAKSAGDWVKSIGGQMANEFSEEAATEVMNILSDIAVMRDKSDAAKYADDYIAAHGASTQAQQDMALALYCAKRVGSAGLAGAITGGVLGGGAQYRNNRAFFPPMMDNKTENPTLLSAAHAAYSGAGMDAASTAAEREAGFSDGSIANFAQNATGNLPMRKETAQMQNEMQNKRPHSIDALFPPLAARTDLSQMQSTTDASPDGESVVAKMKENIKAISSINPVASLTGKEFQKGNLDLVQQVGQYFKSLGNKVNRKGLGDVRLDGNGVKSSIAHGLGRRKAVTFAAVPSVIQNGIQIDSQLNWKGRGYNTLVFSAPVKVGEEINYVAVVAVKKEGDASYYLHEVVDENGDVIYKKKSTDAPFKTGITVQDGVTSEAPVHGTMNLSMSTDDSIANSAQNATGNLPMRKETAQMQNEEQKRPHNIDAFFPPMEARMTAPQRQSTSSKEKITPVTARTDSPQMQSTSSKAQRVQNRYENEFVNRVGEMMSVPGGARREYLRPLAQKMREEARRDGKISKETADEAFETAYKQGVEIESEFFDTYKDLKGRLRNQKLTLDSENQKSREYADMRDRYFGSLKLTNTGGTPVDVVYMELCEEYPGLFDREIANPLDQLERIGEVARSIQRTASNLDAYYGDFAQEFKRDARAEFDDAVEKLMEDIDKVKRYEDDVKQLRERKSAPQPEPIDIATVQQAYQQEQKLRRKADRTMAQELLTKKDKKTVEKLMRADIEIEDVKSENRGGILRVYAAKKAEEDVLAPVKQYNAQRRAALRSEAQEAVEGSEAWKDKKTGLQYSTETMERNIRDIVKDKTEADKIVNTYFKPVHKHTADATRFKNEMREEIASLKLNQDESIYLQIYGEMCGVEAAYSMGLKRPFAEYENLKIQATEYLAEHKSEIDEAKIEDAVKVFRDTYDTVFAKMNEAYIENGYRPAEYRSGYFPHFQENKADTLILKMAKKMGFDIQTDELPTDIAGLTYNFKPGRKWNPFAKQRMGFKTTYDALKGFDLYIEVAADVIYHTQDIQKLRALEDAVRTKNSTAGIKAEIEEIRENDTLTDEQKQALLQDLYKRDKSHLNQFAQELTEYSNLLASKKSIVDRVVEKDTGRVIYSVMQNLENRIAANMVAINPGSWLTNFIPITQASAECSTGSMLKAARDTVKAYWKDDGFADISTFLTNRKGSEQLSRTGLQKLSEKLSSPMMWIDSFASNVVTRAKYLDNIKSGIDANTAMEQADEYAAGLIGDRSKGSLPTGFERKNPLWKLVTMFQVEANNQLRYLVKDLPRAKQDEALGQLVVALLKYTLGAYLFNDLYEKLVGRRPALDFLGIANEAVGDMTGYQLPNVVDAAQGIVSGKGVDFTTERRGAVQAVGKLAKNTAEEIPFVGGLLGGGRLPVSSAIPDFGKIATNAAGLISGEKNAKKAWMDIGKEVAKPVLYMALPFGGGQVKKAIEGTITAAMGGGYGLNSDGEAVLQFPVENANLGTYAKAAAFGKYSLQTAQDYVNGGFKAKSAGYTKTYKAALDAGMSGDEFRQTWGDMDADKNGSIAQGEGAKALGNANITQEQKEILWKNFASDASIEKYDKAKTQGCKQEYFDMIMHADADASGKITKKELEAYFKEAKLNAQVENLLRQINKG